MIILELHQSNFLLHTLVYLTRNLITTFLQCDTQSFCTNATIKYQIKFIERVYNAFIVPFENSKIISLTSSIMKYIVLFPAHSRFPVKLIC